MGLEVLKGKETKGGEWEKKRNPIEGGPLTHLELLVHFLLDLLEVAVHLIGELVHQAAGKHVDNHGLLVILNDVLNKHF